MDPQHSSMERPGNNAVTNRRKSLSLLIVFGDGKARRAVSLSYAAVRYKMAKQLIVSIVQL